MVVSDGALGGQILDGVVKCKTLFFPLLFSTNLSCAKIRSWYHIELSYDVDDPKGNQNERIFKKKKEKSSVYN